MATKTKATTAPRPLKGAAPKTPHLRTISENPRDRFMRLGQGRMVNVLHAVRLIGNLAGPGYEWKPDDVTLMKATISDAVEEAFSRFDRSSAMPKLEETFKLKTNA